MEYTVKSMVCYNKNVYIELLILMALSNRCMDSIASYYFIVLRTTCLIRSIKINIPYKKQFFDSITAQRENILLK